MNKDKKLQVAAAFFAVITIVAVILLGFLINAEHKEYKEIEDTQEDIVSEVVENSEQEFVKHKKKNKKFSIDWNKLQSINSDVVAWIRIPNSNISYPVVQGNTNNEYLRTNIYKKRSRGGVPFVDSSIENPFNCVNTVVHGHNLMNGMMFSQLKKYSNPEFAKKHNKIYVYFPSGEKRIYKIYSFHTVRSQNGMVYDFYATDPLEYKEAMDSHNSLKTNVKITENSQILTLSTCTNRDKNDRYVLHAVYEAPVEEVSEVSEEISNIQGVAQETVSR